MKKEQLTELGITDEQATKVVSLYNEEIKEFIPKTRFDEVNTAKKQLETDLASRDAQLTELSKAKGITNELKTQIEQLKTDNATAKEKYEAELKTIKINNAVTNALTTAKAKNTKVVMPLLSEFLEKAELDDNGEIKGLKKEIEKLTKDESSSFLFDAGESRLKGFKPVGGDDTDPQPTGLGATMAQKYNSQFITGKE